jgi:hypothetical protein
VISPTETLADRIARLLRQGQTCAEVAIHCGVGMMVVAAVRRDRNIAKAVEMVPPGGSAAALADAAPINDNAPALILEQPDGVDDLWVTALGAARFADSNLPVGHPRALAMPATYVASYTSLGAIAGEHAP